MAQPFQPGRGRPGRDAHEANLARAVTDRPTIVTPFPLADGRVLRVELPAEGIDIADAERLVAVIHAWTFIGRPTDD